MQLGFKEKVKLIYYAGVHKALHGFPALHKLIRVATPTTSTLM